MTQQDPYYEAWLAQQQINAGQTAPTQVTGQQNNTDPYGKQYNGYTGGPHPYVDPNASDPNSAQGVANALGTSEGGILSRQAPGIGQVMTGGLDASRANQVAAIQAQQAQLAGPSLAGVQANQAFGQARQGMGGAAASNPLAMRQAMLGGNQQLAGVAGQGGQAVGAEYAGRLGGLAGTMGTLSQNDLQNQNAMQQIAQAQYGLNLNQRNENLTAAQGQEQNYFNVQSAEQQAAMAAKVLGQQKQQAETALGTQAIGAAMGATGAAMASTKK